MDVSIVLVGEAGQGLQTVEQMLVSMLKLSGFHVYATKEVMSRIRGGTNSTTLRIGDERVTAFKEEIDILLPFSIGSVEWVKRRITEKTIIIGEKTNLNEEFIKNKDRVFEVPFLDIANEIGGKIYSTIVAVGVLVSLFDADIDIGKKFLGDRFEKKGEEIVTKNISALIKGMEYGDNLKAKFPIKMKKVESVKDEILFNGNQAVAIGALAGGCNFISAYPMSPSTGVLVFLSQHAKEFGVVVDQAEDEIAAMNKAIGAWYSGARAIASTSGGGFALMTEALSLAGMVESPVVIHIAQRPGPATGLPTRTGQEDLTLALYGGHGEFPRIIFAPASIEDAFYLTAEAFNLTDKFQVPVFILTDEYLVDSYYNIPSLDMSNVNVENQFIKTEKGYMRYKLTETGISPRGLPGHGEGIVRADSDEHDEAGFITEDVHVIRPNMIDKRLYKKFDQINQVIVPPKFSGNSNYKVLVVSWGSTFHNITEGLSNSGRDDIGYLHFNQVFPIDPKIKDYFDKAKTIVFMEQNATGQFAKLVRSETGMALDHSKVKMFLKYNGAPYSVEEVARYFKEL